MLLLPPWRFGWMQVSFAYTKRMQKAQIWLRYGQRLVTLIAERFVKNQKNRPKTAFWYNFGLSLMPFPV